MQATGYSPLPQEDAQDDSGDPLSQQHDINTVSITSARPSAYYGETDHQSPEAEAESLLDKNEPSSPTIAERGELSRDDVEDGESSRRSNTVRCLAFILALIVAAAAVVGLAAGITYKGSPYAARGVRKITMDHIFNGTFSPDAQGLLWVEEAGDGVFSISQGGFIQLVDLKNNSTRNLVAEADVKDEHGHILGWSDWKLSPNMRYILFKADTRKQWRYSTNNNYYVHNLETASTHPIIPPSDPPITSYASWSPLGESIAYVASNDLYILESPSSTPIRVTAAGNASLFHGVPDWVYEEEVFSADYAFWWSPDSAKLAFLRSDETAVNEFTFPIYNPTDDSSAVIPYTHDVVMKYPKPGYNNPLVSVHVFDLKSYLAGAGSMTTGLLVEEATLHLDWNDRLLENDSIISEVAWVANDMLIIKELNRNADIGNVVLFDLGANSVSRSYGRVVRKLGKTGEEGDDGWLDCVQNIVPLSATSLTGGAPAYLDIVPSPDGYNHIALFSPADSATPHFLTSGKWEVTGGIQAVDVERDIVYFQATTPRSSTERQIYSVPIHTADSSTTDTRPKALTDTSTSAFYEVSFSPGGGFYLLSYQGPNIPWQKVVKTNDTRFSYVLTSNSNLNKTFSEFESPVITFSEIESDGYKFNVKEIRPPKMDDSGRNKYPLLFRVYGGPSSQMVDTRFSRDWEHYLACGLQYIIVVVDGRGTGFKGRKHRNPVKGNLGFWETKDQITAARLWAAKPYVDRKRIGIWGWSYGGFMSSKVIEADAGIHSLAIAVAPVTSWRLYDSIYTERYMNLPDLNPGGYINASISNVTGFHKADFLLMHGSGDDNVHFANSAHLLDMLTKEKVRNFRFRMFTDSDHRIKRRGASREIYEYMTAFLIEKWGKGGRKRGW